MSKKKSHNKSNNSPFTLYCVQWTEWEGDEYGYPKTDGYSLHCNTAERDSYVSSRKAISSVYSASNVSNINNPNLYREVRASGGSMFTDEVTW